MVKKRIKKDIWWICEVCGNVETTKKGAKLCEKRKPERVMWIGDGEFYKYLWKVGDILLIRVHDYRPKLVKIVGETIQGHKIVPELKWLDMMFDGKGFPTFEYPEIVAVLDFENLKSLKEMLKDIGE